MTLRLASAALLLATAGCRCGGGTVVARVGDTAIHAHDVELAKRGLGGGRDALTVVIDEQLLAEAARDEKLHKRADVAARVKAAERSVLAQAYREHRLAEATGEEALRKRYDEQRPSLAKRRIHVQHIAVQVEPALDAQEQARNERRAQTEATRLYAELNAGKEMAELARLSSDDAPAAAKGGDLGPILEGQVDQNFFDAAVALKRGELSQPIRTAYGFHVIRALSDPDTVTPTFEQVRANLAAELRRESERLLLEELHKEIPVKVMIREAEDKR